MALANSVLSRFERRTTSGRFIPVVEGLRFVSIMFVVLFHINGYLSVKSPLRDAGPIDVGFVQRLAMIGHYGVQLFFVISGFVLALPFAAHQLLKAPAVRLRAYFLRRVTRLEPPYVLSMLGLFLMHILIDGANSPSSLSHLGASLAYLHNQIYATNSTINTVAWSLEVEVQFYLLAPLLASVFLISSPTKRRATLVAGMLLAVALQTLANPIAGGRLSLSIVNYIQFFLLGFLLADYFLVDWKGTPAVSNYWDVVAVVGWPALAIVLMRDWATRLTLPALVFVLFCAGLRGKRTSALLSDRWVTTIGGMCYSIYLLHYPIISAIARHTVTIGSARAYPVHLLVQSVLLVSSSVLISALYFMLIERPCMDKDWPRRLVSAVSRRVLRNADAGQPSVTATLEGAA